MIRIFLSIQESRYFLDTNVPNLKIYTHTMTAFIYSPIYTEDIYRELMYIVGYENISCTVEYIDDNKLYHEDVYINGIPREANTFTVITCSDDISRHIEELS